MKDTFRAKAQRKAKARQESFNSFAVFSLLFASLRETLALPAVQPLTGNQNS
jgi:hypothetical protein